MNNIKKRNTYLIIAIITGCIFGCGFLGFVYIWFTGFQGIEPIISIKKFFPYYFIAIICGGICQISYNQYKKLNTGIQGEVKSQNVLSKLPSSYQILSNVPLSYEGRKAELDNLIISPKGIVIVESKNYSGSISGNENDSEWSQLKQSSKGNTYTNSIKNPIKQVKRQTYILSHILKENGIHCWIDGYVYMAGGQCRTDSDKVYTDERKLVQAIIDSGKENALDENDIRRIQEVVRYSLNG